MRLVFLFFLSVLFFQPTFSQALKDGILEKEKNWAFDLQIDQRNTVFLDKNILGTDVSAAVNGITFGFTYQDRFRIGIGGYFSNAQSAKAFFITDQLYIDKIKILSPAAVPITKKGKKGYLVNSSLNMYYVTPSFEYTFFQSKWLDLSIPLEIGIGYCKMEKSDFFNDTPIPIINAKGKQLNSTDVFIPALVGFTAMLNLSPDVGFAGSVGYRKILKEIGISQNFDGLYYSVGLQLIPENIIAEIKKDFINLKNKRKAKRT